MLFPNFVEPVSNAGLLTLPFSDQKLEILAIFTGIALLFAGSGLILSSKTAIYLGAFAVAVQLSTIDNPYLTKSVQEKEEAYANFIKDIITIFSLVFQA